MKTSIDEIRTAAKLDKIFSKYIRLRDTDDYGNGECCTCGEIFNYYDLQCGHFRARRHESVRWDERNAHVQCEPCNNGNKDSEYLVFMLNKYPDGKVPDQLVQKSKEHAYFVKSDYEEMYQHYLNKAKELLMTKMFIVKL